MTYTYSKMIRKNFKKYKIGNQIFIIQGRFFFLRKNIIRCPILKLNMKWNIKNKYKFYV